MEIRDVILICVTAIIGGVVGAIVFKKWPKSGKWGINRNPIYCPECGFKAPKIRIPKNSRQFLWGGCTCKACNCEFDKYGNEITL